MVKSILCIMITALLLIGAAITETVFVNSQFDNFSDELHTLSGKVEAERANEQDGLALRLSWEEKKKNLHVWIPHNDIARVDDILSEAIQLIGEKEYSLAAAKIEILLNLCKTVPGTYRAELENIL